jgi:hypothetical protein
MNIVTPEFKKVGIFILSVFFVLSLIPIAFIWVIYAIVSSIIFIPMLGWSWRLFRIIGGNFNNWANSVIEYINSPRLKMKNTHNPIIKNPDSQNSLSKARFYWATVNCRRCGALVNIYAYKNIPKVPPRGKCPVCGISTNDKVTKQVAKFPQVNNELLYAKENK